MRTLDGRAFASICFILLLRLAGQPCVSSYLQDYWLIDPWYLDSLLVVASQALTGDPTAAVVLEISLQPDRWPLNFDLLNTEHDLLHATWFSDWEASSRSSEHVHKLGMAEAVKKDASKQKM